MFLPRLNSLATMVAIAALASGAEAKEPTSVSFGVGGGVSVPVGESRDALKTGFHVQTFVRLDSGTFPLGLRADFAYQNFDLRASESATSTTASGTGTLLSGLAHAQAYLRPAGVRPYLLMGLGGYRLEAESDDPATPSRSETGFSADGGAGVAFTLSGFAAYAEGRVESLLTESGIIDARTIRIVPLTLGVVF